MPGAALTSDEREEIRAGIERRVTDIEIAGLIGRHASTVGREIARNGGREGYRASTAQQRADRCRERAKVPKLVADRVLAAYVKRRLRAKDSPMTISIELRRGVHGLQALISHECIYQAVQQRSRGLPAGLHVGLHLKRRCRKHRGLQRPETNSLGVFNSIHDRPLIALERRQIGHFEGDLIVGAGNKSAIITVFDRTSRKVWLGKVANKTAAAVAGALKRLLRRIPGAHRHSLTWDQGAEIADHERIAAAVGIDIYIADAKSPWQRPTNENGNALVRRYVGKGTDLNAFSNRQLRAIEHRLNSIPRRVLNWATANDIYTAQIAPTG
jgi:IS30 family transposase